MSGGRRAIASEARRSSSGHKTRPPSDGRWTVLCALLETVADTGLRDDELWARRILFDLPSQVGDVYAKVLLRVAERTPPHGVEDLLVGERAPRCRREAAQDLPLDGREVDGTRAARDAAPHEVDRQPVDRDRRGVRRRRQRLEPAQVRPHAGRELERAEGLGD